MAYDASNNKNLDGGNVAGSNPLSQGGNNAPVANENTAPQAPSSQPATFQAGSSTEAAGQAQQAQTASKPASSGMFTNIKKYVEKNKPQAQKMSGAVAQNVGNQANEIAEQAKQKQNQLNQTLQANQQSMDAQKKEATNIVRNIMDVPAPVHPAITSTETLKTNIPTNTGQNDFTQATPIVTNPNNSPPSEEFTAANNAYDTAKGTNQEGLAAANANKDAVRGVSEYKQAYSNWEKGKLGEKYDEYKAQLEAINSRMMPMDIGPGSANEAAGLQKQADRAALQEKYGVSNENYENERYAQLMSGAQGLTDVGQLNLAAENQRMQALGNLAQGTRTEQGRMNLLRDTFGQGDQEYTRGMSGLDQLITSGDANARNQLITGVQNQATGLENQLRTINQEAKTAVDAQNLAKSTFGKEIDELSKKEITTLDNMMKEKFAAELENRQSLQPLYGESIQSVNDFRDSSLNRLGDTTNLQNIANQILGSGKDLAWKGNSVFNEIANASPENTWAGSVPGKLIDKNDPSKGYYGNSDQLRRIDENRFRDVINAINQGYQFGGEADLGVRDDIFNDIWGTSKSTSRFKSDQLFSKQGIKDAFSSLGQSISDIDAQALIDNAFSEATRGQNLEQYLAGEGLDKYDTADQSSVDSYNRLQRIRGEQDIIDDTRRNTDFTRVDALQNILNRYKG